MRSILWTPILILFASVFCSAQNTLYIPQVANGFDPGSVAWCRQFMRTADRGDGQSASPPLTDWLVAVPKMAPLCHRTKPLTR